MADQRLGTDLAVRHRGIAGSAVTLVTVGHDRRDLVTVSGLDNLAQAIWLRLATNLGELSHLGHPGYGSRLYRLIGRLINPATVSLARAYVREAIRREPRVAAVESLAVYPDGYQPGALRIELAVKPATGSGPSEPLTLALSFTVDPEVAG